jgi:hypothetical protein
MAEVKVKITAANQTQTGFQSVLADAKKTATQVQQTFSQASAGPRMPKLKEMASAGPMDIDIGDYGLGPLRELQEELKRVRQSAQQAFDPAPPQQFGNGIGGVLARFALLIGAAASIGKLLASAFDQASAAVSRAISIQEQFNQALTQAGRATSLSGAISEFRQLSGLAEQTGKTLEQSFGRNFGEAFANVFQGKPGQLLARLGSALAFNAPVKEIQANESQQRSIALTQLDASLNSQINNLKDIVATGGDKEAAEVVRIQQERKAQLDFLVTALKAANVSDRDIQTRVAKFNEVSALQDQTTANEKRLEAEREISKERERQAAVSEREAEREAKRLATEQERLAQRRRDFNASTELLQARASGDTQRERDLLERQDFERGLEATGSFEDAANFAAASQALRDQKENKEGGMAGSFGASQLQRIGFASNEFFDTRRKEDPSKLMQQMVSEQKKTNKYLGDAGGLYLQSSS